MNCALVTGASRGIGRAIAIQLAKDHGLHIIINYSSNEKAAQETLAEIVKNGGSGDIVQFNVENKLEVTTALEAWTEKNKDKEITVLVNNAGITRDGMFMMMSEKDWDDVINVSVKGMYNCTQFVIQKMLRKRAGRIINIASLSGVKGNAGQTNYSAAKGAMVAATKALAQEIAKRNVTVNVVAPGLITSDMTSGLNAEEFKKFIPAQRFGDPSEVAHLVSFLASEKSSYITGEVININGGLYS